MLTLSGRNSASRTSKLPVLSPRRASCRLCLYALYALVGLSVSTLLFHFLLAPLLVSYFPDLDVTFYDFGVYGINPERSYRTFNLTSELAASPRWNPAVCEREWKEGGLVLLDVHGAGVTHGGPRIVDLKGNLIWTDNSYGEHAMNLRLQEWKGERYLTFWAGLGDQGDYFMLDRGFNHVRTVRPVGEGLRGDPHEFIITTDDTALVVVYNCTQDVDFSSTHMMDMPQNIVDAVIQEIDLESGDLLFEWRASEHFNDGEYLKYSFDASPATIAEQPKCLLGEDKIRPIDYFHLNSVSKDSEGNFLVSIRKTHQVISISRSTGKISWGFGGRATDFDDLGNGEPGSMSDFKWQHDARWFDEERGILTLFDNGVSETYDANDNARSLGRVIQLDIENRTAEQLHSYSSLNHIRSVSQGSFQLLPGVDHSPDLPNAGTVAGPRDQVFIGWGAAPAFTLHDAESEELLCETHLAPQRFFFMKRTKTYRALRAPKDFNFRPERWDPQALASDEKVYVSWNGGMEVRSWMLQGCNAADEWVDVFTLPREGFETSFDLPKEREYSSYTVVALDDEGHILRRSNVFQPTAGGSSVWTIMLMASAVLVVVGIVVAYGREARRHARYPLRLTDIIPFGVNRRMEGYRKVLEPEELGELRSPQDVG